MAVQIKLNSKGFIELLKSPEIQADLRRRAELVAAAAGPGHKVDVQVGRRRARAAVIMTTWEARRAEAKTRNLTQAFNAARGG